MAQRADDFALRPATGAEDADLLRAILCSTHYGVMLTDLGHTTIGCNARFGQIFSVDIGRVVHSNVESVRRMVRRLIPDLRLWEDNLSEVYADPTSAHLRVTPVSVAWERCPDLPRVLADPHQLDHMFVNLILNAVQAMNESGGQLTIRSWEDKGSVVTEVTDTGRGMPRT